MAQGIIPRDRSSLTSSALDPSSTSVYPRRTARRSSPTTSTPTLPIELTKRDRRSRVSTASEDSIRVKMEYDGDEDLLPNQKRRKRASTAKKQVVKQSEDVKPDIDVVRQAATIVGDIKTKPDTTQLASLLTAGPSYTAKSSAQCSCGAIMLACACVGASGVNFGNSAEAIVKEEIMASEVAYHALADVRKEVSAGSSEVVKGKKKGIAGAVGEFRPGRFRKKCPKNTKDRVDRVMTQRMFLVDRERLGDDQHPSERFRVLGSTGNVYTIIIGASPSCDCPDCLKGNVPCKHIVFVLLKVLKVPESNDAWYQKGLTATEVREIFSFAVASSPGSHGVSDKIKNAYLRATGLGGVEEGASAVEDVLEGTAGGKRTWSIGEDCPVCYEEMSQRDQDGGLLVYDEALAGCGKPIHKECFGMWVKTAKNKGDAVTCVWCRTPWPVGNPGGTGKGKSAGGVEYNSLGYMNMADLAGISRQRDTSSYYHGPVAGRMMASLHGRYSGD